MKAKNGGIIDYLVGSCFGAYRSVKRGGKVTLNDIWANCGLIVRRTGETPLLPKRISERKRDYGRDILLHLPVGLSDLDFYRRLDKLFWAFGAEVELEPVNGQLLLRVMDRPLGHVIPYAAPEAPAKMALPVPVGYSRAGLEWLDLAAAPHLLICGVTNSGKSCFIHGLCESLAPQAELIVVDLKGLEYAYLEKRHTVATALKETGAILVGLNRELDKRVQTLKKAGAVKIQDYHKLASENREEMPYIVLVIDELAEIDNQTMLDHLNRLLRLARAAGIQICGATQRADTETIKGGSKAQFYARLCFKMASEVDSRVVLGDNCSRAAYLPNLPGRALFKFGAIREVQTMLHPASESKQYAENQQPQTTWDQRQALSNA